jgi:hypothetical protein
MGIERMIEKHKLPIKAHLDLVDQKEEDITH